MSKQTAMQELKEFCEYRQTKATAGNKAAWNMILAKIKDDELIELEEQQTIDALHYFGIENAEQYYNETFNK